MSGAAAALAEAVATLPAAVRWGPLGLQLLGGLLLGAGAARASAIRAQTPRSVTLASASEAADTQPGSPRGGASGALLGGWLVATTWARSAVPSPLDVPRAALIPAAALGFGLGVLLGGGLRGRGPVAALRAGLVADLPAMGLGLLALVVPDRPGAALALGLLAVPMLHLAAAQGFGAVVGGAARAGGAGVQGAAGVGGPGVALRLVRVLLHLGLLLLPLGLRGLEGSVGLAPALVLVAVLAGLGSALDGALRAAAVAAGAGRAALVGAAWAVAVPSLLLLPLPARVAPFAPFAFGQADTAAWLGLAAAEPDEGRRVLLLQATMAADPVDPRAPARLALLLASRGRCADAVRAARAAAGLLAAADAAARDEGHRSLGLDPGALLPDPEGSGDGVDGPGGAPPADLDEAHRDVELAARAIAGCFGPPADPAP